MMRSLSSKGVNILDYDTVKNHQEMVATQGKTVLTVDQHQKATLRYMDSDDDGRGKPNYISYFIS